MMEPKEKEIARQVIRDAHHLGVLQHLIGDALNKNIVLVVLGDVVGAITLSGDTRAGENHVRDRSMLTQMTKLLSDNMNDMMKQAGKETREQR